MHLPDEKSAPAILLSEMNGRTEYAYFSMSSAATIHISECRHH